VCEHAFVDGDATILHADLDAFYASVEQRDDPRLRGRPVIVGAGVVLAASYEAKAFGVRTAMGGRQARRLCPQAVVVPPRMSAYAEASKAVYRVFEDTSPLVEGLSIDEAFLDVRGMERIAGTPGEIALRLKRAVHERVGLPRPVVELLLRREAGLEAAGAVHLAGHQKRPLEQERRLPLLEDLEAGAAADLSARGLFPGLGASKAGYSRMIDLMRWGPLGDCNPSAMPAMIRRDRRAVSLMTRRFCGSMPTGRRSA